MTTATYMCVPLVNDGRDRPDQRNVVFCRVTLTGNDTDDAITAVESAGAFFGAYENGTDKDSLDYYRNNWGANRVDDLVASGPFAITGQRKFSR